MGGRSHLQSGPLMDPQACAASVFSLGPGRKRGNYNSNLICRQHLKEGQFCRELLQFWKCYCSQNLLFSCSSQRLWQDQAVFRLFCFVLSCSKQPLQMRCVMLLEASLANPHTLHTVGASNCSPEAHMKSEGRQGACVTKLGSMELTHSPRSADTCGER